jgi:hypothetical protein
MKGRDCRPLSGLDRISRKACVYKVPDDSAQSTFTFIAYALTNKSFSLYSQIMENELLMLESKLEQLLALVTRLRGDNAALVAQLTTSKAENDGLRATINATKVRIEQLVASIPDEADDGGGDDDEAEAE